MKKKKQEGPTDQELKEIEKGHELERFEMGSNKDLDLLARTVYGYDTVEEFLKR